MSTLVWDTVLRQPIVGSSSAVPDLPRSVPRQVAMTMLSWACTLVGECNWAEASRTLECLRLLVLSHGHARDYLTGVIALVDSQEHEAVLGCINRLFLKWRIS